MSILKKGTRVTIKNTSFFKSQKESSGVIWENNGTWYLIKWNSGRHYNYPKEDIVVIDFNKYIDLCKQVYIK